MKQYLKIRAGTRAYRVLAGALHCISSHMRMYFKIQISIQHYHVATIMQFICFMATEQQQFAKLLMSSPWGQVAATYRTLYCQSRFKISPCSGSQHLTTKATWCSLQTENTTIAQNNPKYMLTCANLQCVGLGEHTQTAPAIKPMLSASNLCSMGIVGLICKPPHTPSIAVISSAGWHRWKLNSTVLVLIDCTLGSWMAGLVTFQADLKMVRCNTATCQWTNRIQ